MAQREASGVVYVPADPVVRVRRSPGWGFQIGSRTKCAAVVERGTGIACATTVSSCSPRPNAVWRRGFPCYSPRGWDVPFFACCVTGR